MFPSSWKLYLDDFPFFGSPLALARSSKLSIVKLCWGVILSIAKYCQLVLWVYSQYFQIVYGVYSQYCQLVFGGYSH